MKRVVFTVALSLRAPIVTRSSSIGTPGVDAVMARGKFRDHATEAIEERYYIPGSLVKGLIRESWQELSTLDDSYTNAIRDWFGVESPKNSHDEPERGRLHFTDFCDSVTDPSDSDGTRCRIQIEEAMGAAASGMLQVIESPYTAGSPVTFHGKIQCLMGADDNANALADRIRRGLLWPRGAGAARTSGFGRIEGIALEAKVELLKANPEREAETSWSLRLRFEDPLIFSKHRVADNLFESSEILSGGAIKGAIADMMTVAGFTELARELHLVRFTHAFPANQDAARPAQWPLSVRGSKKNGFSDTFDRKPLSASAPSGSFEVDWKREDEEDIRSNYGWPDVKKDLRVRTAIDSDRGNAAEKELFAWEMLRPHGLEWVSWVDATRLSAAARNQLHTLLDFDIEPLGKTKAIGTTHLTPNDAPVTTAAPQYVVTLQTPTLLIPPLRLNGAGGNDGGSAHLRGELETIWSSLSAGTLTLIDYFQRCSLAGGEYYRNRFGKKAKGDDRYRPYLLSNPGSVFLLRPVPGLESEALQHLNAWLHGGLPISDEIRAFHGIPDDPKLEWRCCPYLPENGYGEIAVNQASPLAEARNVQR